MRWWNVSGLRESLFFLFLLSGGCTNVVDPNVSLLSYELPSMKNTGESPFDQELEAKGYILLQGTCSPMISELQLRFDERAWQAVSATAGTAPGGVTPPTSAYDVDCSDGSFSFFLFEADILSFLPAGTDLDVYDPQRISLRGVKGPFATEPLVFRNSTDTHPAPNAFVLASPAASKVDVGLCLPMELYLVRVESGGGWSGRVSNAQNRQVTLSRVDFQTGNIELYRDASCGTVHPGTTTMPAGQSSLKFYVRAQGGSGTVGSEFDHGSITASVSGLRTAVDASLTASANVQFIHADTVERVAFDSSWRRPAANSCESLRVLVMAPEGVLTSNKGPSFNVSVSKATGSEDVQLFEGRDCRTSLASPGVLTFANGEFVKEISYRVTSSSPRQISLSSAFSNTDGTQHFINPWRMSHAVALMDAPLSPLLVYQQPDCRELHLMPVDAANNPQNLIPSGGSVVLNLMSNLGSVDFFSTADCSVPLPGGEVTFGTGQASQVVWWKDSAVRSLVSFVQLGFSPLESPYLPPRVELLNQQLVVSVAPNYQSFGAIVSDLWRLPRGPSGATQPVILPIPPVAEMSSDFTNSLYPTGTVGKVFLDASMSERVFSQEVMEFTASGQLDSTQSVYLSESSRYLVSFMFRTSLASSQFIMGFPASSGDQITLDAVGTLGFAGCSFGVGLNDGVWHVVTLSRPDYSLSADEVFVQIDSQSVQSCVVASPPTYTGTAFFGVGGIGGVGSFDGQIAEITLAFGTSVSSAIDSIWSSFQSHYQGRYPLR